MANGKVPELLADLAERLQSKEALDLEFKSARGGLPNAVWETVSAFANTIGGWIILGVNDETLAVEDLPHPDDLVKRFYDLSHNTQKISYSPCRATDVMVEEVDGRRLVVIRVPAAPRRERPVYIGNNPYQGTFIRRHEGDYRCRKPEVDRMMREASDSAADSTILPGLEWGDLDTAALAGYRRRYQTQHSNSPWNEYDDQRFLESVGGYRRDRQRPEEGLTVAGLLMFGKDEAIRDWRSRHLIDYRLVADPREESRWDDRLAWEGNLFAGFQALYSRLTQALPTPFRIEDSTRPDESRLHVALREALVNLLVHADYAETQASLVIRSPQEYQFRNPGSSRISESDLLEGNRSDPRNPELLRMFRFIGWAEEAGTGIPSITKSWRELGFQLPEIDVGTERYEFSIRLRHLHLLSEEDVLWLAELGQGSASETARLALVLARHEGYIDNVTLRQFTGMHPADVTKELGKLRHAGLLEMQSGGRGAYYVLSQSDTGSGVQLSLADLADEPLATERTDDLATQGGEGGGSSGVSEPSTGDSAVSSGDSGSVTGGADLAEDQSVEDRLEQIAEPSRGKRRLPLPLIQDLIVSLCAVKPLTMGELAQLLQRKPDYLRQVLRRLRQQGRVSFLHPDQPTHRFQAYVAGDAGQEGRP